MMEKRLYAILKLALKYHATDIHFNVHYQETKIEMRIDDKFKRVKACYHDDRLFRYLQYLADLDVGNILKPQTGQFEMEVEGILLSLRFAVINGHHFSNGVLRILNSNLNIDIHKLSSLSFQNKYFQNILKKPYGLIVFSGPTGSGKTTTLYAMLRSIATKKIYTIEDPIEVYNDNFVQLEVNESIGFDYSAGIKQILRHDPDVIMIGEIRDEKAAKMAVVAANTGHLVLTTIHASKASSIISRLEELGVNSEHLYEILLCLVNQRMMITLDNKKRVLYEIMDTNEIAYYRKYQRNSDVFLDINKQISKGSYLNV